MKTKSATASVSNRHGGTKQQSDASTCEPAAGGNSASREQMIAEAAYFHAERHGFDPKNQITDWLQAEADVSARLAGGSSAKAEAEPVCGDRV